MEFRLQRTVRVMTAAEHARGDASREYWRNRPPEERLAAVEFLRRQHGGTGAGLRRVLRVVDRAEFNRNKRAVGHLKDLADIEALEG